MQQKIEDGVIFVKASKEEGAKIKSWRMMKYEKEKGYWYGSISIPLLQNLKDNGGLIPKASEALKQLMQVQAAIDAERVKPDEEVKCLIKPPVKADLFKHQARAMNMALINFGIVPVSEVSG